MSEQYAPDEPSSFDAIVERQPYEPAVESADPFVGKEGLAEAADEVSRGRETRELRVRQMHDPDDLEKIAGRDITWTKETAADALRSTRNFEAHLEQAEMDAQLAAGVDEFRGQQPAQPPTPEFQQAQPQELAPQAEVPPAEPNELDRMLAELPEHRRAPFVAAFNGMVTRAQYQASTEYQQVLQQAQGAVQQLAQTTQQTIQVGEAIARQPFPELHGVPDAELPAVLGHLQRTNPQRYGQIVAHTAQVKQLVGQQLHQQQVFARAQQQQQQEQQVAYQKNFKAWANAQDDLLEKTSWANESPQNRSAIAREIVDHYRQHGISEGDLASHYQNNPAMRHVATQSLLLDGIRYRQAQKAAQRAQVRPLPAVQRPGTTSDESRDYSEYAHLERQYRGQQSLTPKQAAELVIAKRARR